VRPKPASTSTWSRVTSSCARRRATSGAAPLTPRFTISTFLPATVSPCSFTYSAMPSSIFLPVSANGPESSAMTPTLI